MKQRPLSIWELQAAGMKREDEKRYNTFSVGSIYLRLTKHLEANFKTENDFCARDFSQEGEKLRMLGLHKSSIETLCYYIEKKNPSDYVQEIEKEGLYSLILRYELYFVDFKDQSEILQKLKADIRPKGIQVQHDGFEGGGLS